MKNLLAIAMLCVLAAPAFAGEKIAGTNTYVTNERTWPTGQIGGGYYMYDSTGEFKAQEGPIPSGPVECHGAGFWTDVEIKGDGICIFGSAPDRWTVSFIMEPGHKLNDSMSIEKYRRRGMWKVVLGTGKYRYMTGSGFFITEPVVDGRKVTQVWGEVDLPK